MAFSNLDAKVRDLCEQAVSAEGEELQVVLADLRKALREQSERARSMVAEQKRRAAGMPT
jgi:hypothetical protein